jgi:Domain of unknown function (DUF4402)
MRKLILISLLLSLVAVIGLSQTVSQSANVTATVNTSLTLTKLTDMTFPAISQGGTATILSNANAAASFLFQGSATTATTVTVTAPAYLLDAGSDQLTFTAQPVRTNTVANSATSTPYTAPTNTTNTGQLWVYNGGTVTATAIQPAGQYTGTITVTVTQ